MKNIAVIGTGYVGLVQGVILAEFGMQAVCMDVDVQKIERLRQGILPIYEPGLGELLDKNMSQGRLRFTSDMQSAVLESEVIFIAVGTPPQEDGSADLHYVEQVARQIGQFMDGYRVIVDKSTVPVGTGKYVRTIIQQELEKRGKNFEFDVVSNPEFLREGKAVQDCLRPDRVVIGTESERAAEIMRQVYDVLYINQTPFLFTNLETAEMIKYASNAFLAVKISFINEMALLADQVGADVQEIARGMGMDGRISPKFLHAGPGYGGSCFPKDTRAIAKRCWSFRRLSRPMPSRKRAWQSAFYRHCPKGAEPSRFGGFPLSPRRTICGMRRRWISSPSWPRLGCTSVPTAPRECGKRNGGLGSLRARSHTARMNMTRPKMRMRWCS